MLTGQMRFRESILGKAILQVEETGVADSNLWRDATIDEAELVLKQSSMGVKVIDSMTDWADICCGQPVRLTKKQTGWYCPKCNKVVPL